MQPLALAAGHPNRQEEQYRTSGEKTSEYSILAAFLLHGFECISVFAAVFTVPMRAPSPAIRAFTPALLSYTLLVRPAPEAGVGFLLTLLAPTGLQRPARAARVRDAGGTAERRGPAGVASLTRVSTLAASGTTGPVRTWTRPGPREGWKPAGPKPEGVRGRARQPDPAQRGHAQTRPRRGQAKSLATSAMGMNRRRPSVERGRNACAA